MSEPKVSVVMTCYKYAHFLPFALDSVLGQTYGNVEAVMVNDGSPDNTDEVMQPYLADPRVKYVNQKNAGQAIAKNNGIRNATGEFIAFLDADDIWELNKLEKQMPLFADPEVGIVYSRTRFIDEKNVVLYDDDALTREYLKPQRGWIAPQLFLDNFVPFSATVTRRECFEKVGVFDESFRMGIDWDLWLRMSVPYKYDYVDERLLKYRVGHAGQMSKNLDVREVDTTRIMEKFLELHPNAVPREVVKQAMVYTYCNRGYRYRTIDAAKSLRYYLKALAERPTSWTAMNGIAKLGVYKAGRAVGLFGKAAG
jgi:glycosyltransferase involved in cell wall biosynthesis